MSTLVITKHLLRLIRFGSLRIHVILRLVIRLLESRTVSLSEIGLILVDRGIYASFVELIIVFVLLTCLVEQVVIIKTHV